MKQRFVQLFVISLLAFPLQSFALKNSDPLPANAFIELARMINPAVVNISTSTMPKMRMQRGPRDPMMEMLEQFYGLRMMPQNQKPMQALGTGFIIREDGLIVTNNHVVAGADVVQVQLSEKSKKLYDAKVIGSDERTDIALLKITSTEKLPVAQLGSSKELEVGEWVAAFGNPFGQGHTMTKGIISATGRDITEINKYPLIQTDTPINPGNSGGPLVNLKGQVIGVNSAIDARAQGIGFAIPIDEVKNIIPQLEKNGKIRKGYLGVVLDELNPQSAMYLGLKDTVGALIASVDLRGPAKQAGIKPYDVIVEFNGKKTDNVRELMDAVADAPIGSPAKVKLMRDGKQKSLEVTVADRPDQKMAKNNSEPKKFSSQKDPLNIGFAISDINEQIKKQYELSDEVGNHPVVTNVEEGSKAEQAGLLEGDVILEVNRKEVTSVEEIKKQLKKGTNTLRIARGDGFAIIMF